MLLAVVAIIGQSANVVAGSYDVAFRAAPIWSCWATAATASATRRQPDCLGLCIVYQLPSWVPGRRVERRGGMIYTAAQPISSTRCVSTAGPSLKSTGAVEASDPRLQRVTSPCGKGDGGAAFFAGTHRPAAVKQRDDWVKRNHFESHRYILNPRGRASPWAKIGIE